MPKHSRSRSPIGGGAGDRLSPGRGGRDREDDKKSKKRYHTHNKHSFYNQGDMKKSHKHHKEGKEHKKKHKKHHRSSRSKERGTGGSKEREHHRHRSERDENERRARHNDMPANGQETYRDRPHRPEEIGMRQEPRREEFQQPIQPREYEGGSRYTELPPRSNARPGPTEAPPSSYQQTENSQASKRSRFSDIPIMVPEAQQQKKKKFVWTDADENDLKNFYINEKRANMDENQPALMIGSNANLENLNPTLLSALQDASKIKKKIYLPKNTGVNYIGMLIGPKGLYQKRLEEESGCKILIRGKGSQKEGSAPQPDDDDDQHVLIIGDSAENVKRAQNTIERVITADDTTRNKIRQEQLTVAAQLNNSQQPVVNMMDDSMMTPYGPPSPYAYIIPVPNDCVGLVIGKGGETIRQLQIESGAKIQVAKKEIPNSNLRNVFVEGAVEKYQRAKEMIEDIIREHRRATDPIIHVGDTNPFSGSSEKMRIPDKYVGLVIGKSSENLKGIAARSNTKIFVPQKKIQPESDERIIEIVGDLHSIEVAKSEINQLIQRQFATSSSGGAGFDFNKNPYGSGIAVYNQTKLASDGQQINGAVPDALKPESGSYASNILTENPMLAYNAMQLTGWSYDSYPGGAPAATTSSKPEDKQANPEQGHPGYDQSYYYGQQAAYPGYDAAAYQDYWAQYYQNYNQHYAPGQAPPQAPPGTAPAEVPPQNPEVQLQQVDQASAVPVEGQAQVVDPHAAAYSQQQYDYSQYYQQHPGYYQQYYGQQAATDPAAAAYYQQYYAQQAATGQPSAH